MMVSCKDVLDHLSDFIDQGLDPSLREAIEAHLRMCHRCSVLHDSTRKMLIILGDERAFEIPAGMTDRLHAFLDKHM